MTGQDMNILAAKIAELVSTQPRWMKLRAAAQYSSIGQKELVRLAQERKIDGFQDLELKTKPWIFDRESIDKYRSAQFESFNDTEDEDIALDIIGSLDI